MSAAKVVQRFSFSMKHLTALDALFATEAHGKAFIRSSQQIVGHHHSVTHDVTELPPATAMRRNARAIEKAAKSLLEAVGRLTQAEAELVGQFMWMTDKINYYPGASSVERSLETVAVIQHAARGLVKSGNGGRPGLRLDGLIRELHASYVTCFKARPTINGAPDNRFVNALKICVAEAGISRPPRFLGVIRDALGEGTTARRGSAA